MDIRGSFEVIETEGGGKKPRGTRARAAAVLRYRPPVSLLAAEFNARPDERADARRWSRPEALSLESRALRPVQALSLEPRAARPIEDGH